MYIYPLQFGQTDIQSSHIITPILSTRPTPFGVARRISIALHVVRLSAYVVLCRSLVLGVPVCVCLVLPIPLHAARRAMAAACRCPCGQRDHFPVFTTHSDPDPVPNDMCVILGLPDLLPPMAAGQRKRRNRTRTKKRKEKKGPDPSTPTPPSPFPPPPGPALPPPASRPPCRPPPPPPERPGSHLREPPGTRPLSPGVGGVVTSIP